MLKDCGLCTICQLTCPFVNLCTLATAYMYNKCTINVKKIMLFMQAVCKRGYAANKTFKKSKILERWHLVTLSPKCLCVTKFRLITGTVQDDNKLQHCLYTFSEKTLGLRLPKVECIVFETH